MSLYYAEAIVSGGVQMKIKDDLVMSYKVAASTRDAGDQMGARNQSRPSSNQGQTAPSDSSGSTNNRPSRPSGGGGTAANI
jgi:hypothetical protein